MKNNSLVNVHNMLVEQMRKLSNIDTASELLTAEIQKTEAMVDLAGAVTENADVMIKATRLQYDIGNVAGVDPILLGEGKADATSY